MNKNLSTAAMLTAVLSTGTAFAAEGTTSLGQIIVGGGFIGWIIILLSIVSLALAMLEEDVIERQRDLLRQLRRNKGILLAMLEGRGFVRQVFPGEANFVLIRADDAPGLLDFSARRKVVLRGFPSEPALRDCIRISVGSTDDLARLEAVFDAWEERQ